MTRQLTMNKRKNISGLSDRQIIERAGTLLGGIGTLYGPVLGAMLIVYLKNLLSTWVGNWHLILGGIFIVSVLTLRQGIFPVIFGKLKEKLWSEREDQESRERERSGTPQ